MKYLTAGLIVVSTFIWTHNVLAINDSIERGKQEMQQTVKGVKLQPTVSGEYLQFTQPLQNTMMADDLQPAGNAAELQNAQTVNHLQ